MRFPECFIAAGSAYADLDRFVPAPFFRKEFTADHPQQAEIVITATGFYRLFLNGEDVTKGVLAPYISNPDDLIYYDRYDVTDRITDGTNTIAVLLGNGFQNNPGGAIWDFDKAPFRGAPSFAMRLCITAADGGVTELESDESFRVCDSPIRFDDYRCGEFYDARLEQEDFTRAGFDDHALANAVRVPAPRGEKRLCTADPVVVYKELKPVSIRRQGEGWLYDFGENGAGICRLNLCGQEGQTVTLRYGEWLRDGALCLDNIRFAQSSDLQKDWVQKSVYVCKAGPQTHVPSFIYNGFRYVLVEGVTEAQATPELFTCLATSSLTERAGDFTCSDDTVNAIQQATLRSDASNFHFFPTDCPQREKNGWTADASLSAEQLLLNFRPERSYKEWMRSIFKALNDKGQLPGIVPTAGWGYHWGNGPAWDNVLINLPYYTYLYRGDREMLEELATPLMRYLNYLFTQLDDRGLIAIGLGDWCQPGVEASDYDAPLVVTDTILTYDIAMKAAFVYEELNQQPQRQFALALAERVKAAFRAHLLDGETGAVQGNTQTGQAMAIAYGLLTDAEKDKAFALLLRLIDEKDGHLNTGVLGGRVIFRVLAENGQVDLAYHMIVRPDYPSYGNWIRRGATTLWEDFQPEGGPVNSLNHHFWGDVSAWFYIYLAGIRVNPTRRDTAHVDVQPLFPQALNSVAAHHDTPSGRIATRWQRTDAAHILLHVDAAAPLHGSIRPPKGWHFADNSAEKPLATGDYVLCND